jgi:hypothetical protein
MAQHTTKRSKAKAKPKRKPRPGVAKKETKNPKPSPRPLKNPPVDTSTEEITTKPTRRVEPVEVKPVETTPTTLTPSTTPAPAELSAEALAAQNNPLLKPRPEMYLVLAGEYQVVTFPEPEIEPKKGKKGTGKLQWTPARRRAVAEYIAKLQGILRLRDWEIAINFEPAPASEEAYATIVPEPDQRRATLQFTDLFFSQTPSAQRQTLVHEMLHCYFFGVESLMERMLNGISEDVARACVPAMNSQTEMIVDAIADAFAPLCPEFELPSR